MLITFLKMTIKKQLQFLSSIALNSFVHFLHKISPLEYSISPNHGFEYLSTTPGGLIQGRGRLSKFKTFSTPRGSVEDAYQEPAFLLCIFEKTPCHSMTCSFCKKPGSAPSTQWRLVVFFAGGGGKALKNWVCLKIHLGATKNDIRYLYLQIVKYIFLMRSKLSGFSLNVFQYSVKSTLRCFLHLKTSNGKNNPDQVTVVQ